MGLCACPNAATLETIADYTCPIDWADIVKFAISRKKLFQSLTAASSVAELQTLAEWAPTLAAVDDTKTLITPLLDTVENEPGEAITEEFSTRTINNGLDPTVFTGLLVNAPAATVASFKKLSCEKELYIYFFDNDGNVIHALNGALVQGFKLTANSFIMQDTDVKNKLANKNAFSFQLEAGWSDIAAKTVPTDYDPLSDLSN